MRLDLFRSMMEVRNAKLKEVFFPKLVVLFFLIQAVKPGCTILISDDDLLSITSGKLNMMTVRISHLKF